jgi:hypothetical protein
VNKRRGPGYWLLAAFFGTDAIPFTTTSDELPGVTRSYPGFSAAADEAGVSRIYGGIHWPSAVYHGQASGYQLAQHVFAHLLLPLTAPELTLRPSRGRPWSSTSVPTPASVSHSGLDRSAGVAGPGDGRPNLNVARFSDTSATGGLAYRAIGQ